MSTVSEIGLRFSSRSMFKRLLGVAKRLILLYRSFVIQHVEIEGIFHAETGLRTLVYIGEGESLSYLRELCFSKVQNQKESGCRIFQMVKLKKSVPKNAIVVVELNRLLSVILKGEGHLTYPWVLQKVFITSKEYLEKKAYILKSRSRRARKRKYRYDTTNDQAAIGTFYHQFYKPYIVKRYKATAHLRDIRDFLLARHHGLLLRIFDDDRWVAGVICLRSKRELICLSPAVLAENRDHLKQGAMLAAYYHLFQWAEENHMETVSLLRSRPHGSDGVFHHKTLWGAVPLRDSWPHTCCRIIVPHGQPVPEVLKEQLVWEGSGFIPMKTAAGNSDRADNKNKRLF
jgi:hypothetical protein